MSAPTEVPTSWTTGWSDVFNTGTWRAALPVHDWRPSPCHVSCPVDGAVPIWIRQLADGDPRAAWETIVDRNPFPAVTGRICHHPCEGGCNRTDYDGPVGINSLEHFLGDEGLEKGWALPAPATANGLRVAVVGGGPAGLACAYHLRRAGSAVTVFEARSELGGLLLWGIPEYRLAKAVVRQEIARLLALGIEVRTDSPVADEQALRTLEQEYDAVFVAIGAQRARALRDLQGGRVLDGLGFLRDVNAGRPPALGEKVVVVGGGSAAMDVARTARRLGSQVTVVALESRETLPAQEEEVLEALEEGVALFAGAMVQRAEEGDDLRLDCVRVHLDESALPAIVPVVEPGGDFTLYADQLIVSIGQDPDLAPFAAVLEADAGILSTDESFATNREKVFAGGDVASLDRFVSVALGQGRDAAAHMLARFAGAEAPVPKAVDAEAVKPDSVNFFYVEPAERAERSRAEVDERLAGFVQVAQGLAESVAVAEAARCISCGTCLECDNCVVFCPDMAVKKDDSQPRTYLVLDQYCKGCGLCVVECPRGVVRTKQEVR